MANVPAKSIKFPGLENTYTFLQNDATLTQAGKAADAKVTGDKVAELKSATKYFKNAPYYTNMIDLDNYGYSVITTRRTIGDPIPTTSGLTYSKIKAKEKDVFIIKGVGATDSRLWAFVDANMNVLATSDASLNAYDSPVRITAPHGTAFLFTNTYVTENYPDSYVYRCVENDYVPSEQTENILPAMRVEAKGYGIDTVYENGKLSVRRELSNIVSPNLIVSEAIELQAGSYSLFVYDVDITTGIDGYLDISLKAVDGSHEYNLNVAAGKRAFSIPETNYYTLNIYRISQFIGSFNVGLVKGNAKIDIVPVTAVDYIAREAFDKIGILFLDNTKLQNYLYSSNIIYRAKGDSVGKTIDEIYTTISSNAKNFLIDVSGYKSVHYPVFASVSEMGSLFLNENNVIVKGMISDKTGFNTVSVPDNAKYMLVSVSGGWYTDYGDTYSVVLYAFDTGSTLDDGSVPSPFKTVNRNMCLAGIKTKIQTNKIPFHEGYLFHKLQNNDSSLWYGTDFGRIEKIGNVGFNPTLMRFAISPKDGRIIAVQRDARNGIWIWDGTTETHLTDFETQPQAWLYNAGVDFINDGTDEYCVFAEYYGTVVAGNVLNVWRGKYPYTSVSDWNIVFSQEQRTDITHFHMIRRDPWTNVLYLTAGDYSNESKWWYSTDFGATWTLLVSGTDTGWGNSLCRTINFIFTEEYIYWATDHGEASGEHHTLNRIARNTQTGIIDLSTKEQLALLPKLYATNSLCYVESPNGLFMYDRIDTASDTVFGEPIKMLFWDFATEQLIEIASLKLTQNTWGGSRGKCYINYTNTKQPMPAMGFSIDTPCIFDLVCDNPSNIGTIAYDVGSKTVRTIDY